jgi:hypothetical protein
MEEVMAYASDAPAHEHELTSFSHPRYFYGQRLDVRHFEGEQDYFKGKLWLLNRLVHGYGVVCGLDVQPSDDRKGIVVMPGVALDRQGHEIVVPCRSEPVAIPVDETRGGYGGGSGGGYGGPKGDEPKDGEPPKYKEGAQGAERYGYQEENPDDYVQILLCFHTCDADPEPVLAGGCDSPSPCAAGSTRERYRITVREGKAPPIRFDNAPDLLVGNRVDYAAIARWVSQPCASSLEPCIPLANVKRPHAGDSIDGADIDISIRPVVFTLDLLFQLIAGLTGDYQGRRGGKY